jgi:hypothetical protein
MTERSRRVVLLIDYDNLQICAARDTPGRDLQLAPVVQFAQRYGTVILARAYAEWNLSTERLAVYKAGIEPAFAPVLRTESDRSGKSLADTVMVAEGMDMLWTLSPEVVVLATSDKDLIPLVRVAKQRGAFVVVLGSDFTAIPLREMADEHVTYRQLISDAGVRYATEAGPGRQPAALPEPSRRRRERDGRERTSSPAPAQAASRPEREAVPASPAAQPAAAPAASGAATPASAEPVAPFTAPVPGEADAQTSGRRRRRRGSRRRSDRLGLTAEELGAEASADGEEGDDALDAEDAEGLVPTSEEEDEELGLTASEMEAAEADAVAEGIEIEGAPADAVVVEAAPVEASAEGVPIAAAPAEAPQTDAVADAVVEGPVVRERRPRRTRRRVTEPVEATPVEAETTGAAPVEGETAAAQSPVAAEPAVEAPEPDGAVPSPGESADIEPAPPPTELELNGASTVQETLEGPAEPVRRPRRVASASRGRSRRP